MLTALSLGILMGGDSNVEYKLTFTNGFTCKVNGVSVESGYILKSGDVITGEYSDSVAMPYVNGVELLSVMSFSNTDINIYDYDPLGIGNGGTFTINFSIT